MERHIRVPFTTGTHSVMVLREPSKTESHSVVWHPDTRVASQYFLQLKRDIFTAAADGKLNVGVIFDGQLRASFNIMQAGDMKARHIRLDLN